MRITFFCHYFPPEGNAPASRTYEHCKRWVAAGHNVTVITCAPNVPNGVVYTGYRNTVWPRRETVDGIKVLRVWTYLAANSGGLNRILNYVSYMLSSIFAFTLLCRRPHAVIATSPQFFCGWAGAIASWIKWCPFILEIRDIWPESIMTVGAMKKGIAVSLLEKLEILMYRSANLIVTVGNGYRQNIIRKMQRQKPVSVVTNGVDLNLFQPRKKSQEFRNRYNLGSKFVCSYVGTIGMAHGLDVVVRAAKQLQAMNRQDIIFCLVGDGAERSQLEVQVAEAGVSDWVKFTGRLAKQEMAEVIASSDCSLIHLRKSDLFQTVIPSKIFETMAMERPIVMGVEGESAEIVSKSGAGLMMESDNDEQLVDRVVQLCDDPVLYKKMCSSGRQFVSEHYSRDKLAAMMLEQIEAVVQKNLNPSKELAPISGVNEKSPLDSLAWHLFGSATGNLQRVSRSIEIIRHYRLKQLARRGVGLIRNKLTGNRRIGSATLACSISLKHNILFKKLANIVVSERANHSSHANCDLNGGQLVLLNHTVKILRDGEFDQSMLIAQPQLWRFQFHYHEYLLTAAAKGKTEQIERFLALWLTQYDASQVSHKDDGWHPYCISRRVVTWLFLLSISGGVSSKELRADLLKSIVQQCEYLMKNAEYDIGGNHVLENATALAIAGGMLECLRSKEWLNKASIIFNNELSKQILDSGEHFERSPIYHCHVVSNLLRILICSGTGTEIGLIIKPHIKPMLQFLESISHPDGEVPLFADSVFQESSSVSEIRQVAALCSFDFVCDSTVSKVSDDYTAFRDSKLFAIFDHGPVAADGLPAHGHCDALNLEISIEGERWIVDSGNFDYEDGAMRHYCRSSLAHNVVTVENHNQASIWSKFRMGNRPVIFDVRRGVQGEWAWARGSHDGYKKNSISSITRTVAQHKDVFLCSDRWDAICESSVQLIGYVHFHPLVNLSEMDTADGTFRFTLALGDVKRILTVLADSVSLEQGWYCPEFGKRVESQVVRYVGDVSIASLAWVLHESTKLSLKRGNRGAVCLNDKEQFFDTGAIAISV